MARPTLHPTADPASDAVGGGQCRRRPDPRRRAHRRRERRGRQSRGEVRRRSRRRGVARGPDRPGRRRADRDACGPDRRRRLRGTPGERRVAVPTRRPGPRDPGARRARRSAGAGVGVRHHCRHRPGSRGRRTGGLAVPRPARRRWMARRPGGPARLRPARRAVPGPAPVRAPGALGRDDGRTRRPTPRVDRAAAALAGGDQRDHDRRAARLGRRQPTVQLRGLLRWRRHRPRRRCRCGLVDVRQRHRLDPDHPRQRLLHRLLPPHRDRQRHRPAGQRRRLPRLPGHRRVVRRVGQRPARALRAAPVRREPERLVRAAERLHHRRLDVLRGCAALRRLRHRRRQPGRPGRRAVQLRRPSWTLRRRRSRHRGASGCRPR